MNVKKLYLPADMPEPPAEIRDAATYCLHRMHVGRGLMQTRDEFNRITPYTRLHSSLLQDVVHNYHAGLEWLEDRKLIEIDRHYIEGKKCRGYRWANDYEDVERVPAGAKLSKRMTDLSRTTFRQYSLAHKHLISWLKRARLDVDGALAHLEMLRADDPVKMLLSDAEYRRTVKTCIRMIVDGSWLDGRLVCDYGRFHSPYTCLLSCLRQYVTFEGQNLINIDIANSQPMVLALLFPAPEKPLQSRSRRENTHTLVKEPPNRAISDELFNSYLENQNVQRQPEISTPENTRNNHLPEDMQAYISDCEQGLFYNKLMAHFNIPAEERGDFKRTVFREICYGAAREATPLRERYIEQYPHVWELIKEYKKGNYKRLSWEMQRAESRIMIDSVGYRLYAEHPNIPAITIHDSIMTTPSCVERVERLMLEEFYKVGLRPKLNKQFTLPLSVV